MDPSVLIIDDNANLTYFTAYSLRQVVEGLKVVTAGSCKEALAQADEHQPSVLIVDLRLPDGSGLELINALKSRLSKVVPILISATPVSRELCKDLFGVLVKPYDPEALIDLVRQALQSGDSWRCGAMGSEGTEPGLPAAQYDFHHVQNRLSGLLTGIRALRLELLAVANDPSEVRRTIDEYTDRLSAMVKDAAEALKRKT